MSLAYPPERSRLNPLTVYVTLSLPTMPAKLPLQRTHSALCSNCRHVYRNDSQSLGLIAGLLECLAQVQV